MKFRPVKGGARIRASIAKEETMTKSKPRTRRLRAFGAALGIGAGSLMAFSALPASASTLTSFLGAFWTSAPNIGGNIYLTSASTTFVVPTVNCTGITRHLGENFGVEEGALGAFIGYLQALVTTECHSATPSYHFRVAVGTIAFVEGGVSPGDTVVASWFYNSSVAQAIVHDLTSGVTWDAVGGPPPTALSSPADIGEFDYETPSNTSIPPAPFGTETFTQSEVNGDYLGFGNNIAAWNLQLGKRGYNITTGPINSDQESFSVTFDKI
jgi:hypothetical protein